MNFLDLFRSLDEITRKKNNCLFGKQIFETRDNHGVIRVFESKEQRTLTFDSAYEQSCINLDKPYQLAHQYTRAMLIPTFFQTPERALVLGLGGGAMVHFLHHYFPEAHIDVVELRAAIIDVAQTYLDLPRSPALSLKHQDAHIFLRYARPAHYDLLLADMYLSEGMDMRQATHSFVRKCASLLTEDGWLACNLILPDGIKYDFLSQLESTFPTLYLCNLKEGNAILLGCRAERTLGPDQLSVDAHALQATCGYQIQDYLNKLIRFS